MRRFCSSGTRPPRPLAIVLSQGVPAQAPEESDEPEYVYYYEVSPLLHRHARTRKHPGVDLRTMHHAYAYPSSKKPACVTLAAPYLTPNF